MLVASAMSAGTWVGSLRATTLRWVVVGVVVVVVMGSPGRCRLREKLVNQKGRA
jgi:hypothetical protein